MVLGAFRHGCPRLAPCKNEFHEALAAMSDTAHCHTPYSLSPPTLSRLSQNRAVSIEKCRLVHDRRQDRSPCTVCFRPRSRSPDWNWLRDISRTAWDVHGREPRDLLPYNAAQSLHRADRKPELYSCHCPETHCSIDAVPYHEDEGSVARARCHIRE